MPRNVPSCVLVDPKAPPEFIPAPALMDLIAIELELRALLLRDAHLDDAAAVAFRPLGNLAAMPRRRAWPLFAALHELRQVDLRIRLLGEVVNAR